MFKCVLGVTEAAAKREGLSSGSQLSQAQQEFVFKLCKEKFVPEALRKSR